MRFKISLNNFKKIKNVASIATNSLIGKTNNDTILLVCQNYSLLVYGNDGIINLQLKINESDELKIIQEGKIFINSKTIIDLVDHLKEKEIEIYKVENNTFQLTCGRFTCDLSTVTEQKFIIEDFKTDGFQKISLNCEQLKEINYRFKDFVKQNIDISSNVNNAITGINLNAKEKILKICSTDAFSVVYGKFDYLKDDSFEVTILPNTLQKILSLIKTSKQEIELFIKESTMVFKTEEFSGRIRLISNTYPSFLHWFDVSTELEININRQQLIEALERSSMLSSQNPKTVIINIENNQIIVENKDGQRGSSKETILIEKIKGENLIISFDSLKLKNLLKNIRDETVFMKFISETKPVIISSKNEKNYQQIILPTRMY